MYKVPIRILQHITVDHPVGPKQNLRGSQEEWNEKKRKGFLKQHLSIFSILYLKKWTL